MEKTILSIIGVISILLYFVYSFEILDQSPEPYTYAGLKVTNPSVATSVSELEIQPPAFYA